MIPTRVRESDQTDNHHGPMKDSALSLSSENSSSSSTDEHLRSSLIDNDAVKDGTAELRNPETSDFEKCFSESRELVPCLVNASSALQTLHPEAISDLASTSTKSEDAEPLDANMVSNFPPIPMANVSANHYVPLASAMRFSSSMSQMEPTNMPANDISFTENSPSEGFGIHNTISTSPSDVSTTSTSWLLLGEEPSLEGSSSGSAFLSSSGPGELTDGTILHVDLVSLSSNILPRATGEINNHEARRNSRRLFWDAFSRRSSRRNNDYAAILLTTEDADDLGSHDRSLLDIGDDLFGDDSIYLRRRRHGLNGRSWHSRSEIRDRFRSTFDGDSGRTSFCPTGLHPDGTCSCDSLLSAEESSTRASISRIVMLAEALFEVLDEIHRQPALSLSMVSLPAPESVVNSLPLKHFAKLDSVGSADDVEQCYICLSEYEEGDGIRVLPCCHEYHMSCVDKWLKEIHGVCPLCRRNVCEGAMDGSAS